MKINEAKATENMPKTMKNSQNIYVTMFLYDNTFTYSLAPREARLEFLGFMHIPQ